MGKKYLIGFFIGAVFIYFAFRNVEFAKFLNAFLQADYRWIFLASFLIIFSHWLRAIRWRLLLLPIRPIPVSPLFKATLIGYFSGFVLPLRIGELVRAIILNRIENVPLTTNLGSIFVERILDLLSMFFVFGISFAFFDFPGPIRQAGGIVFLGTLILATLITIVIKKPIQSKVWIEGWMEKLTPRFRERAGKLFNQFLDGMKGLGAGPQIPGIIFLSVSMWLIYVLDVYLVIVAYHFDVPFIAPFVVIITTAFAQMIPSAPGQLGAFQLACQIGLGYFGIHKDTALSFSFVLQAIQVIPLSFYSFYYLPKIGLSLTKVAKTT